MAERVKRRVAAARLAVAFVAAGTIAGASAWASAGPAPSPRKAGGEQIPYEKIKLDSSNVENRSLLYRDFKKGQIPSLQAFDKLDESFFKFKKAVNKYKSQLEGQLDTTRGDLSTTKGELGSYVKTTDADARYIKMGDAILGDGSVFNAVKDVGGQDPVPIISVPNLVNVDALPGEQQIRITNISAGNLTYSQCGGISSGGTMAPGDKISCATGEEADVMQLIGGSGVTTLNFSSLPAVQAGARQYIIAILVGM